MLHYPMSYPNNEYWPEMRDKHSVMITLSQRYLIINCILLVMFNYSCHYEFTSSCSGMYAFADENCPRLRIEVSMITFGTKTLTLT